jgi:hypothetical protein
MEEFTQFETTNPITIPAVEGILQAINILGMQQGVLKD